MRRIIKKWQDYMWDIMKNKKNSSPGPRILNKFSFQFFDGHFYIRYWEFLSPGFDTV